MNTGEQGRTTANGDPNGEQIAKALDIDVSKIRSNFSLLEGIHPDAIELLKDKPITSAALRLFKKAKAVRQIDMEQLMVSANNYAGAYADALIIGTPADQLARGSKAKAVLGIAHDEIVGSVRGAGGRTPLVGGNPQ